MQGFCTKKGLHTVFILGLRKLMSSFHKGAIKRIRVDISFSLLTLTDSTVSLDDIINKNKRKWLTIPIPNAFQEIT